MSFFARVIVLGTIASVPFLACGGGGLNFDAQLDAGDGGIGDGSLLPTGQGVGQPCDDVLKCRPGLACSEGKCEPGRSSEEGTACVISAECKTGLYCGPERKCAPAGAGEDGASCSSDGDCKSGLRCNLVGLGAVCQPEGTSDVGGQCKVGGDCFGGLACVQNACAPLPPGEKPPLAIPSWTGVECKDVEGPVIAYFRVPRGTDDGDFFRLPFPNDIRRDANGHPKLTGFPTPGSDLLGFDVVDRYVKDVEANADGFSAYPTVTMRFSGTPDFETLKISGSVRWVDVTAGAGNDLGLAWSATSGRNAYVCNNSIGIRPRKGEPLIAGHTYAVFITRNAKLPGGTPVERAPDMTAMLGGPPTDPVLLQAYNAYAPLRTWAASKSFDLTTILTAAVFTVGNTTRTASQLATAIETAAAPTAKSWVKCGGGAVSPCPDAAGDRACPATPDPDFDELHALVSLPIFQKGTAPYMNPTDGGDIATEKQRDEDVCMSLIVPKDTMPAGGWPLVVYAHGTGGSFRSHVSDGKPLAAGAGGVKMAVLGIDQVAHGPRRGASTESPNNLFFNFTNPAAARGNPLQGAADQLALFAFAKNLVLPAASSPTGAEIRFERIAFWGHSQGATEGGIALAYAPQARVQGAVLSGSGASLIDALLSKTSPVNIAAAVPFVLSDPQGVDASHPVLALLQNAIDPADPLNHARAIVSPPNAKHLFVPYGQKDTYTPSIVQQTFVLAAGLGHAQPPAGVTAEPIDGLTPVPTPASPNLGGSAFTGYTRQYAPNGFDGHFVAQKDSQAMTNTQRFLSDLSGPAPPTFGR